MWVFRKWAMKAQGWEDSLCAVGVAALSLHVSDDPSLVDCESISQPSAVSDDEVAAVMWSCPQFEVCLSWLKLPTYGECQAVINMAQAHSVAGQLCVPSPLWAH